MDCLWCSAMGLIRFLSRRILRALLATEPFTWRRSTITEVVISLDLGISLMHLLRVSSVKKTSLLTFSFTFPFDHFCSMKIQVRQALQSAIQLQERRWRWSQHTKTRLNKLTRTFTLLIHSNSNSPLQTFTLLILSLWMYFRLWILTFFLALEPLDLAFCAEAAALLSSFFPAYRKESSASRNSLQHVAYACNSLSAVGFTWLVSQFTHHACEKETVPKGMVRGNRPLFYCRRFTQFIAIAGRETQSIRSNVDYTDHQFLLAVNAFRHIHIWYNKQ